MYVITDKPVKLTYRWYTSNIRIMIGITLHLRCNTLHTTKLYKTSFSWKKVSQFVFFIKRITLMLKLYVFLEWETTDFSRF